MFIKYNELKKTCKKLPTELNSGYILALFHNNLLTIKEFNELSKIIIDNTIEGEIRYPWKLKGGGDKVC